MIPEYLGSVTHRILFEQSVFYPVYRRIIGALRIRLGHVFCSSFDRIMPVDRFFLGGPTTIRGYDLNTVPPIGLVVDEETNAITEFTIQGGRSMFNLNTELRIPLLKSFDGVVFQDFGILSKERFWHFKEKWYPTTGFGLRYDTPFGAIIRFDIGWKWNKTLPQETGYAWYLTLGHAF
jgi:outer membrane translocation and assembly module TamA